MDSFHRVVTIFCGSDSNSNSVASEWHDVIVFVFYFGGTQNKSASKLIDGCACLSSERTKCDTQKMDEVMVFGNVEMVVAVMMMMVSCVCTRPNVYIGMYR